jgi:aminoglycoside phosphotransferase (APT) family kinase protein
VIASTDPVDLIDVDALSAYLRTVVELPQTPTVEVLSGGRSNLTFLARSGPREYVLRRRPLGPVDPGAHDMAREYRVQAALQGRGLPLAEVYGFCDDESIMDAPFYVMSRIRGQVFHSRADVVSVTRQQAAEISRAVVEVLVHLHGIDAEAAGLADLGRPEGFVARRIARWTERWRRSPHRDFDLIETLGQRLAERVPAQAGATLVHGDFRLGNMIVEAGRPDPVAAVLDWEMSTRGDPLTDLAHLLVYWSPTRGRLTHDSQTIADHPGFLGPDALADLYATTSGRDVTALPFYLAFEHWRAAIIKEGIYSRSKATAGEEGDGEALGSTVALHLEEAAEILRTPGRLHC